jgi:hypothetical protein
VRKRPREREMCGAAIETKHGYVCACRHPKGHRGKHRCRYGQCVRQWTDREVAPVFAKGAA